jgi:hypothetical protein
MALPALVLVHGGGLAADSWELTVDEIHRVAPELTVLALDMPGRRNKPGDLKEMTIADFVDSLVGDIECAGLEDVVLVGHSIGGMTLPGVVTQAWTSAGTRNDLRGRLSSARRRIPCRQLAVGTRENRAPLRNERRAERDAKMASAIRVLERNSLASPPIHDRQALRGITSRPHRECVLARNA